MFQIHSVVFRAGVWRVLVTVTFTALASAVGDSGEALAQMAPPAMAWDQTYGGRDFDEARAVAVTPEGEYVVAGWTNSFGAGLADLWLVRTNAAGVVVWSRTFGGPSNDRGFSLELTPDGGAVIAGVTESFGAGKADVYLVKTDGDGYPEWQRTYGGAGNDLGFAVRSTADGGYVVAGWTASFSGGRYAAYLVKTDAAGTLAWERALGEDGNHGAFAVQLTDDPGYVVTGWADGSKRHGFDLYLATTDATGALAWERTFSPGAIAIGMAVQVAPDGGYVVAGQTGGAGAWLFKTDRGGQLAWQRFFGYHATTLAYDLQPTPDGGYVVAGWADAAEDARFGVYLVHTTLNGEPCFEERFTGNGSRGGYAVKPTPDGGYVVAGWAEPAAGGYDGYLLRLRPQPDATRFIRGDSNGDGAVNLTDAIVTLQWLFANATPPRCQDAADATDDGVLNLTDPIATLIFLFSSGASLPAPFPLPGVDPTADSLACASPP